MFLLPYQPLCVENYLQNRDAGDKRCKGANSTYVRRIIVGQKTGGYENLSVLLSEINYNVLVYCMLKG